MARCKLKASLIGTSCVGFSFLKGEEKTTEERRDDATTRGIQRFTRFLHCALGSRCGQSAFTSKLLTMIAARRLAQQGTETQFDFMLFVEYRKRGCDVLKVC